MPVIEVGKEPTPLNAGPASETTKQVGPVHLKRTEPDVDADARSFGPVRRGPARFTGSLNPFVDRHMRNLSRAQLAVWLVLFRDTRNGIASVAHREIARRAGVARETVSRAVTVLKRRGLLRVIAQGGLHDGASTYELVLPDRVSEKEVK
mgnify:CR=1 FL=1